MSPEEVRGDLISTREAADIFGVHYVTIRKWVKAGTVPSSHLPNGRLRLSRSWCIERMKQMGQELHPNGQGH